MIGTKQLLFCADDVNLLEENRHNIKKNTVRLLLANNEIGLEVNSEKFK